MVKQKRGERERERERALKNFSLIIYSTAHIHWTKLETHTHTHTYSEWTSHSSTQHKTGWMSTRVEIKILWRITMKHQVDSAQTELKKNKMFFAHIRSSREMKRVRKGEGEREREKERENEKTTFADSGLTSKVCSQNNFNWVMEIFCYFVNKTIFFILFFRSMSSSLSLLPSPSPSLSLQLNCVGIQSDYQSVCYYSWGNVLNAFKGQSLTKRWERERERESKKDS